MKKEKVNQYNELKRILLKMARLVSKVEHDRLDKKIMELFYSSNSNGKR